MIELFDDLFCAAAVLFVMFSGIFAVFLVAYLLFITLFGGFHDPCR